MLGAVIYKGLKHVVLEPLPAGSTGPFIVGTIAAAAVGLVAIDVLLGYIRAAQLHAVRRSTASCSPSLIVAMILSGWRGATF